MSEFMHTRIVSEYDEVSGKFINRLELGDETTTPDTPVDIRFKEPGYIENVHTIFFKNTSEESNVPRIFGDVTNLVFFDNYNDTNRAGVALADVLSGMYATFIGLSDTIPADYTGAAGKYVRVNSVPDGLEFADGSGGVTAHSDLTQLDFPSCGHSGTLAQLSVLISDATLIDTNDSRLSDARTPTAHTHAWGDITSGVPDYATRWPAWSEVSSKPGLLLTDGTNHMTGDLNFWDGSYRAYIELDADGHFSFYQGLDTPAEVLTLTSEENIMYADLNMSGADIYNVLNFYMYEGGTWDYLNIYNPAGDTLLVQLMSYGTTAAVLSLPGADLNMSDHNINGVNTIKATTDANLNFHDDIIGDKTLSELAVSAYWEEVNSTTIRPKAGYTTIQGIESNDLYIKPASGQILYLG